MLLKVLIPWFHSPTEWIRTKHLLSDHQPAAFTASQQSALTMTRRASGALAARPLQPQIRT